VISTVYMSFFVLPYVVAGVLWLRSRDDWKAFVRRFVALSFAALAIYIVLPAAPPWAAARCKSTEIVAGPSTPTCMFGTPQGVPDGGLLGSMQIARPGANEFVERISTRGWETMHLHVARDLVNSGQVSVNMVAAIPSLHSALAAMVAAFLWRRVKRRWRPLLAAYVLMMAFTLVYSAEHYVIDILLGWALAAAVLAAVGGYESRRSSGPPQYDRQHGAAPGFRAVSRDPDRCAEGVRWHAADAAPDVVRAPVRTHPAHQKGARPDR